MTESAEGQAAGAEAPIDTQAWLDSFHGGGSPTEIMAKFVYNPWVAWALGELPQPSELDDGFVQDYFTSAMAASGLQRPAMATCARLMRGQTATGDSLMQLANSIYDYTIEQFQQPAEESEE